MEMLSLQHRQIPFEIRKNKRAKRLTLKIEAETKCLVMVVPPLTLGFQVKRFLKNQESWIEKSWSKFEESLANRPKMERSVNYYKTRARVTIRNRLAHFNEFYGFRYNRVFFKDQKTRWGSCSSEGNLNFNWRLILAPRKILDYVVVHELCHLKYMDHSAKFWKLVEKQIPDYQECKKWLRENHYRLTID